MREKSHETIVCGQFGPQAQSYLNSTVHAQGEDLEQMARMVGTRPEARVLDLGCGGGHVGFRLASLVKQVVAYDLSDAMLVVVGEEATRRGLRNLTTRQGAVERLCFPNASFDVVASRYSAHHWRDFAAGLAEARRVLKPGGLAVFMDGVSPGSPLLDTWLQTLELLRDPSHARNYSVEEWQRAASAAGFLPGAVFRFRVRLEFAAWVKRIKTPEAHVHAIRSLQVRAGEEVAGHFDIESDGSFTLDTMLLCAEAA
jgi:ubiquinone/menaquinone biosynthesis C-methylase UbiE